MPPNEHAATIVIALNAVILRIKAGALEVLTVTSDAGCELPFGPFVPDTHRTMENGLRSWVRTRTGLDLGYVEQLYTFGNRGRYRSEQFPGAQIVSVSYLALTGGGEAQGEWSSCYRHLPWEDWRSGKPPCLDEKVYPRLLRWLAQNPSAYSERVPSPRARSQRYFGIDGGEWDYEAALQRYQLLYEGALVTEAIRDAGKPRHADALMGDCPMRADHRRILATALSRIRAKVPYLPIVFELLPRQFTLSQLQEATEAVLGHCVHTQNHRRSIARQGWVVRTEQYAERTGGRPAALYRYSGGRAASVRIS